MFIEEKQLKEFILDSGLVSKKDFESAVDDAKKKKVGTGEELVSQGKMSEDDLRRVQAYILGIPFVDLKGQSMHVLDNKPQHSYLPLTGPDRRTHPRM